MIATLVASTASYGSTAVLNFAVQHVSIDKGGSSVSDQPTRLSHSFTMILTSKRPRLFLLRFQLPVSGEVPLADSLFVDIAYHWQIRYLWITPAADRVSQ